MKLSLRNKTLIIILFFAVALSGITVYVSSRVVTGIIKTNYKDKVTELSKTVALSLDPEPATVLRDEVRDKYQDNLDLLSQSNRNYSSFDEYMQAFASLDSASEYVELERALQSYQSLNGVEAVYLCYIDPDTSTSVMMVDARKDTPYPTGYPQKLKSTEVLSNPKDGIPAHSVEIASRGELVTAGSPLFDKGNHIVCYVMVDLSTKEMHLQEFELVGLLLTLIFALTVLISFAAVFMMSRGVVNPINQLSAAAKRYCQEDIKIFHQQFSKLNIHTNDEVESLANSMKQMEQDMNDNIARLLSTSRELTSTRKEKEQLSTIAKRDALTGVRNKYSYDEEMVILQNAMEGGETKFGIVILDLNDLKSINDNYGHDKGDIAIVNLCKVTCDVFSHSPVFRIGGDEFAVILKNDDYDNIQKLIVTFNSTMLSQGSNGDLDPWEKITAAVGYALYDPKKDTGIKSVFHRADAAMYSQKKTMKSRRGLSQSEEPTR